MASVYHSGRRPDRRASAASASSFDRGGASGAQPALGLLGASEREAQDLDRVPRAKRDLAVVIRVRHQADNGPVQRPQRPLERLRTARARVQQRRTCGHALREHLPARRRRQEYADEPLHDFVARWDRGQHVLQALAPRPPELVGIRREHPVGRVLGHREAREIGRRARGPHDLPFLRVRVENGRRSRRCPPPRRAPGRRRR